MVGGITASSPGVKSMSADMFLDLLTMSAPRVARSARRMHPHSRHRSIALGYASAASAAHSRVYGACTAEAAASEALGLSVGGCPRVRRYFGPRLRCAKRLSADPFLLRGDVGTSISDVAPSSRRAATNGGYS